MIIDDKRLAKPFIGGVLKTVHWLGTGKNSLS